MTKKRKSVDLEACRLRKLAAQGRIVGGVIIPEGSVPADPAQQAANGSWSPPLYYLDQEFECVDCGKHEVWTAERQKWYYEVAKGSIYGRAVRCRACRAERRRKLADNTLGDPNRIRTIAGLFARLHEILAPDLAKYGFQTHHKKPVRDRRNYRCSIDYQRPDMLLSIIEDGRTGNLRAVAVPEQGELICIAEVKPIGCTPARTKETVAEFVEEVQQQLPRLLNAQ